jgi:hypothetical protein
VQFTLSKHQHRFFGHFKGKNEGLIIDKKFGATLESIIAE